MNIPNPDQTPTWHLADPFWRSSRVFGESLFFIRDVPGEPAHARLLFPPAGPVEIVSASREVTFETPSDYLVDAETGIVSLPDGSRIPFVDRGSLYPAIGAEHSAAHKTGDDKVGLYFGEGHLFHDLQVEASYEHQATWRGFVPHSQLDRLPATARKLNGDAPVKICIIGDSISAGYNATAITGVPPHMPPYIDLWVEAIRRKHAGEVILKNFAVSGTGMKYGESVVSVTMDEAPDLVVIAYGMNDAGFISVNGYVTQAGNIIGGIKQRNPETEIILVASILGNPEWIYTPVDKFLIFGNALGSLSGPGIAFADLTSIWADLLKVKAYHDLTGNGINHPNDFGHRTMAQCLIDLLGIDAGNL